MKHSVTRFGIAIGLLTLVACAREQTTFLKAAEQQASQAEIAERLGPPRMSWELSTGETLWSYQYGSRTVPWMRGVKIEGPGWVIGRSSPCIEYILRFDQEKILRAWNQQEC